MGEGLKEHVLGSLGDAPHLPSSSQAQCIGPSVIPGGGQTGGAWAAAGNTVDPVSTGRGHQQGDWEAGLSCAHPALELEGALHRPSPPLTVGAMLSLPEKAP